MSGVPTVSFSRVDVDEGKETVLSCQASQFSGLSDPIMFGWFKLQKGLPVSITSRVGNISGLSGGRTHFIGKLTFGNTKQGDAGDYKCKAYNRYGTSTLSAAATIVVKCECATCQTDFSSLLTTVLFANFSLDGPESVTIYPAKPVGVKGTAFTFTCSAVGNPVPSYWWQVPNSDQRYVGKTLTLNNTQFADDGMYTCFARTTLNAGFKTASVRVKFQVEGKMLLC